MQTWRDENGNRWNDNLGPMSTGKKEKPTKEMLKRGERRRRIEDILQASGLEQEVFGEVWEQGR